MKASGFGGGGEDAQPMHGLDLLTECLQQTNVALELVLESVHTAAGTECCSPRVHLPGRHSCTKGDSGRHSCTKGDTCHGQQFYFKAIYKFWLFSYTVWEHFKCLHAATVWFRGEKVVGYDPCNHPCKLCAHTTSPFSPHQDTLEPCTAEE